MTDYVLARPNMIQDPVQLDTEHVRVRVSRINGEYDLLDKRSGELWRSPRLRGWCRVGLRCADGRAVEVVARRFDVVDRQADTITLVWTAPEVGEATGLTVHFRIAPVAEDGLLFSYESTASPAGWAVEWVALIDETLATSKAKTGYLVVPAGLGQILPADSGYGFDQTYPTYRWGGCHMQMLGAVRAGSAALVAWDSLYAEARATSVASFAAPTEPVQPLMGSFIIRRPAGSCELYLLGHGDYVTITKRYRQIVREQGRFVTLDQKAEERPGVRSLVGAPDIEMQLGYHRIHENQRLRIGNEDSPDPGEVVPYYNFQDYMDIVEHMHDKLGIEKGLFLVTAWQHAGHNMQDPDMLPADTLMGGNEGLAACAEAAKARGYLFALYDLYHVVCRESPSWKEEVVGRDRAGNWIIQGSGFCSLEYYLCHVVGLQMAKEHFPQMRKLFHPTAIFLDTLAAAPPMECFDPRHPSTKEGDLEILHELVAEARDHFGVVGSEMGMEWTMTDVDFHEGIVSRQFCAVTTPAFARPAPLFELVYRECAQLYAHQGDTLGPDRIDYILMHIGLGRIPVLSPPRRYWELPEPDWDLSDPQLAFCRGDDGWGAGRNYWERLMRNVYEVTSPLNAATYNQEMVCHRYLTRDYGVEETLFGQDIRVVTNRRWVDYEVDGTQLPPWGFLVESPRLRAFLARCYNGVEYSTTALWVVRSLDGQAIEQSKRLRVYHGFGAGPIRLPSLGHIATLPDGRAVAAQDGGFTVEVAGEAEIAIV